MSHKIQAASTFLFYFAVVGLRNWEIIALICIFKSLLFLLLNLTPFYTLVLTFCDADYFVFSCRMKSPQHLCPSPAPPHPAPTPRPPAARLRPAWGRLLVNRLVSRHWVSAAPGFLSWLVKWELYGTNKLLEMYLQDVWINRFHLVSLRPSDLTCMCDVLHTTKLRNLCSKVIL